MRKRWIAQGMILPAVLFWVSAASAQYVKGTREASKAFFRGDEEVDFVVRLDNPGAAAKSITVVEALPEGWTVVSTGQGGTAQTGGSFTPGLDQGLFSVFNAARTRKISTMNHPQISRTRLSLRGTMVPRGDDEFETGAPEPWGDGPASYPHPTVSDRRGVYRAGGGCLYGVRSAVRRVLRGGVETSGFRLGKPTGIPAGVPGSNGLTDDQSHPPNLQAGDWIISLSATMAMAADATMAFKVSPHDVPKTATRTAFRKP